MNLKRNICRPFVLCNDFIPPTSNESNNWQYLSWGYFDGITVEENLFKNDKSNEDNLNKLCQFYYNQSEKLEGSYSTQIVFGIRTELIGEDQTEHGGADYNFWKNKEINQKYPFLFITLIQADKEDIKLLCHSWDNATTLEEHLNVMAGDNRSYIAITYLSLDNSDMILVIRSKDYISGANVIDSFHNGDEMLLNDLFKWEMKYTFTVASIDKKFLKQNSNIENIEGKIDSAYIYLIEKKPGSVETVYNKVKNALIKLKVANEKTVSDFLREKQSVLGYNDEVIELRNIPWSIFLLFYQDGEYGILKHTKEIYRKNLNGVTTIIGLKPQNRNIKEQEEQEEQNAVSSDLKEYFCNILKEKCDGIFEYMKDNQSVQSLKKNLYQIINSLQKFEKTPFSDYLFSPLAFPLNMALDMASEMNSEMESLVGAEELFTYYYEFIKGLNLYVQNSNRSDRQFIQIPEFNINIYDIPTKMTAFYTAYIYNLKNYLNKMADVKEGDTAHEYEFLLCPGVANDLHIKEFFAKVSSSKRLFLMESPENNLFYPQRMLIILTHELGHVVGTGVRLREDRAKMARKIVCRMVCKYMRYGLRQIITDDKEWEFVNKEEFWTRLQSKLNDHLEEYIFQNKMIECLHGIENEDVAKQKYFSSRKDYSNVAQVEIVEGIKNFLGNGDVSLWGYFIEREYLFWLGKKPEEAVHKKDVLRNEINNLILDMVQPENRFNISNTFNLNRSIDLVFNMFRECLADLICILTLGLSIEEYLGTILWDINNLHAKLEVGSEIHLRCCIVTYCMQYDFTQTDKEGEYKLQRWGNDSLIRVMNCNDDKAHCMKEIKNTLEIYFGEDKREEHQTDSAVGMLYDTTIMEEISKYLLHCVDKFFNYNKKDEGLQLQQKKLQEVYQQFQMKDISALVINMQIYIEQYVDELKKKQDKFIQDKRRENG